jgi:hypothetical protein
MMNALLILCLAGDLSSIKSEPNLERRSELSLEYAASELDTARDSYNAGDSSKMQSALDEMGASVDLCYQSLLATGKNPRNNNHFKRAELKTRELVRRLDGLRDVVGFDERALVEKVREHVAEVHDELLKGIMSKKK